jgi:cysteine-rich repeat protein
MSGPWTTAIIVIFGPSLDCDLNFVQTGMTFSASGICPVVGSVNVSGAIDSMTGDFSGAGTAGPACPTLALTSGVASLDNESFSVTFACSGGPLPVVGTISGFRCGNGVLDTDLGEVCDDGNRQNGDCCSSTCVYEPSGQFCFPTDFNACTDDVCDGAGACIQVNNTRPCDDDNQCTTGDHCTDGACVSTALPDGSACNDFNSCTTESCQSGTCAATTLPDGTPCDDGYDCTAGETCLGGECPLGPPRVCGPCTRCFEGSGCVVDVYGYSCVGSVTDQIRISSAGAGSANWKWESYDPLTAADFGDPLTDASYEFCAVDFFNNDPLTGYPRLLFGAGIPAGSSWRQTPNGFYFRSPDKKLRLRFKSSDDGKGKIMLRAKGPTYGAEFLPPLSDVETFLRTAEGVAPQRCFYTYYGPPLTSTATKYKAQNPQP